MLLGVFFGIFPLFVAIVNGYLLGFVSRFAVEEGGILILWRLIPHGIFELPAVIISIGLGLKLGVSMIGKNRKKVLKKDLRKSFRFFLFVIFPLLLIAGIIEGILIWFSS
jgi:stage II sporulation protein M